MACANQCCDLHLGGIYPPGQAAISHYQQPGCLHALCLTDADFQLLFGKIE